MSRTQLVLGEPQTTLTVANTHYQLFVTSLFVKSFLIQADSANIGLVSVWDQLGGLVCQLAPGRSAKIYGDNMDNGTSGKIDVSTIFCSSSVGGDKANLSILQNL